MPCKKCKRPAICKRLCSDCDIKPKRNLPSCVDCEGACSPYARRCFHCYLKRRSEALAALKAPARVIVPMVVKKDKRNIWKDDFERQNAASSTTSVLSSLGLLR